MSKIRKLIEKLLLLPTSTDIEDVIKIYLFFGWTLRAGGKHTNILVSSDQTKTRAVLAAKDSTFGLAALPTISGRHVKTHYVKTMIEDLGLREYLEAQ